MTNIPKKPPTLLEKLYTNYPSVTSGFTVAITQTLSCAPIDLYKCRIQSGRYTGFSRIVLNMPGKTALPFKEGVNACIKQEGTV